MGQQFLKIEFICVENLPEKGLLSLAAAGHFLLLKPCFSVLPKNKCCVRTPRVLYISPRAVLPTNTSGRSVEAARPRHHDTLIWFPFRLFFYSPSLAQFPCLALAMYFSPHDRSFVFPRTPTRTCTPTLTRRDKSPGLGSVKMILHIKSEPS